MKKIDFKSGQVSERLKRYGLAAGALAASAAGAQAQVQYTDIADTSGGASDTIYIDVDGDQVDDFLFLGDQFVSSTVVIDRCFIVGLGDNVLMGTTMNSYSYPYALSQGSLIDCNKSFQNASFLNTLAWQTYAGGSLFSYGNFNGATDKYVGFKLTALGEEHYGWIRIDVGPSSADFTIKDFAYEGTANWPIEAGSQTSLVISDISTLTLNDVGSNKNASDIEVSFAMAEPEVFEEYAVIVVKESAAAAFDETAAEAAIAAGNYHSATPDGNNQVFTLPATLNDADGDAVVQFEAYRVFVYGNSTCLGLIAGANGSITLDFPAGLPSASSAGFTAFAADGAIQVLNPSGAADHTVLLTNAAGQLVHQGALAAGQNTFGNGLPAGLYLVKIKNDVGVEYLSKVVVH